MYMPSHIMMNILHKIDDAKCIEWVNEDVFQNGNIGVDHGHCLCVQSGSFDAFVLIHVIKNRNWRRSYGFEVLILRIAYFHATFKQT